MNYKLDHQKLSEFCNKEGVIKKDIIRACKISSQSLYRWLKPEADIPLKHLLTLCNLYNEPLSTFVPDVDEAISDEMNAEPQKALGHIIVEMNKSKREVINYEKQIAQLKSDYTRELCDLKIEYEKQINQKDMEIALLKSRMAAGDSGYLHVAEDEVPYHRADKKQE